MAEVEELLDGVVVRLPAAEEIRQRGQRRRARRRAGTAALCAGVLMAAGAWILLPAGTDRPHERGTVASAPDNPFRENGMVRTLPAEEVPLYGTWHWKENEGRPVDSDARGDLLNRAGLRTVCPVASPQTGAPDRVGYSQEYRGRRDAVARQCLVEYDDAATAREQLGAVHTGLEADGLRRTPGSAPDDVRGDRGATVAWAGTVPGGHTLRVYTRRWESWVSVVEILDGTDTP
ncbi:hypothetical protein [Streptomyces sp. NBC_01243]|uniref:hypothetical protein n=1 Tax=Streptomyces sp. NBC_01243 TaxID=2903796 RepID=UPI002E1348EC|nr:hypothetical protein OG348_23905 [Streptomyces sp. NBC_01243]